MTSLNHSPSFGLSKDLEEIDRQREGTSPARHDTSKLSGFHGEGTCPTASVSFKPSNCAFSEPETVAKPCTRQNQQRPMPWTSSPIIRTNAALNLAETSRPAALVLQPADASDRKQMDRNRCKALDLIVSSEPDGIEVNAVRSTHAKMSLAASADLRPFSAMDRIKRLFNPHSKKYKDNPKETGGNALAKGEEKDPVGWEATKEHRRDHGKQGDGAKKFHHTLNKAGSVPLGMNTELEPEKNRNHRIDAVEPATSHSKQNRYHGWMFKRQRKSDASCAVVEDHSGPEAKVQKGAMLSACLMQASSTSPADETPTNVASGQNINEENVLNSETVDNAKKTVQRNSPRNEGLFMGKQRQLLPEAVLNEGHEPSCSKDHARDPSCSKDHARNRCSELLAAKSLARVQSIENVERWLMHGYQVPRHTKSRQHVSRRSRQNFLCYMSHHRSSISSSEYAISPTDDRHRCGWEHCQSEKGFGSNDSYHKPDIRGEPPCNDVNIKGKNVATCHTSHETMLFGADGEAMHLRAAAGRDACQSRCGDDSMSKLDPSLLQFVAELIDGLEKAKHNDSEWSTRFVEKTSTPVVHRARNLSDENLPSISRRHYCSRSSVEHALNPTNEADLLQNLNDQEPSSSEAGRGKPNTVGPSEDVAVYPSRSTHCVGLSLNSCELGHPSGSVKRGETLNRPISLSDDTGVVHRCTVEQKRTFGLNKLLDDFKSLKIDSRLSPQLRKIFPLGQASAPSLLKQCLLQSMEGKSEILSAQHAISASACGENVFEHESTEIVGHQPFAQLSADGFFCYADGRKIQYNILHQPDPTEVLEEIRLVAQEAKTLQQNTTEILEHVINIQWKKIRSLQSALSEEQAKRQEAERKLEQLTSTLTEGGMDNVIAKLTS